MSPLDARHIRTVAGRLYGTPKEAWSFRTAPQRAPALAIARELLAANAALLGLDGLVSRLKLDRVIESLGARHVILQQRVRGLPVHRAYVTVHVARGGEVYLVKNRAVPRALAVPTARFRITPAAAARIVCRRIATRRRRARAIGRATRLWYPLKRSLRPAYRVHARRERPREEWIVHVDATTGRILRRYDNLATATAIGRAFVPNPVVALGGAERLYVGGRLRDPPPEAYRRVRLRDLRSGGRLDGPRVTTKLTAGRVRRPDGRFDFASTQRGFDEVMAYFHVDAAVRYLEALGFEGTRAIFRRPIPVDANGTRDDNSWYSPQERSLTFGSGGVGDATDADIILHELGHAVQDAICPGFGRSPEAAAMGEGFGDYFAASFFADAKPPRYRTSVGTWDGVSNNAYDPPCLRRVDEPCTVEDFDPDGDEHENGEIWSAALWEVRVALGRRAADRIIVESHFQLDGFTTFARGARAIIDADRNLYGGRHVRALRRVFHRRGIGPVE